MKRREHRDSSPSRGAPPKSEAPLLFFANNFSKGGFHPLSQRREKAAETVVRMLRCGI
jgi:hypothetical protein